jgi:hypothetical protein
MPALEESPPPTQSDATLADQTVAPDDSATLPGMQTEMQATDTSTETSAPAADSAATEIPVNTEPAESDFASEPVADDSNPRLGAWRLGSKLSLVALANDRGIGSDSVAPGLEYCKSLAAKLGGSVADLPASGLAGSRPASRQVLDYLFHQGQQIGRDLTDRHGAEAAALFEVALKSNLLLVLYTPRSSAAGAIADAISQAAPRAELPAGLWEPLVNTVIAKADGFQVRKAVKTFHTAVEQHLAERTGQ